MFGATEVRFPMSTSVRACYADESDDEAAAGDEDAGDGV